ncbi:DUF440 family protein [Pseudoalteromonas sp. McH1-7]|uniref:DsDNA-mimic protein n=1 Tax=Pseudoalteromonas peptidolytica F12-50-A1 TaxID=1315280 RepID=A0A8I0T462_9GAMM|nr:MULTISPECIES: DUF440 family protein [Pseudoalteromonas]MBE0345843.1 hypothetical protein [Pseudoalteromonas peptidolytica F12-50-A1]MDW7547925.1 DUF440 family protein [Pseudoalteromonas peptidolytica]NLR16071.1 DUF440 family protein [Pseudoalteromonas peptidolytica]NUZ11083.1 DUF440 family protein [Pseudoalteromonas sp. McH1-7]RRS07476.1 DUF440 family protein [Pseudoalteromonas sp. J010]
MTARLCTIEEVTHQAYDIFLELAPDNLEEHDIETFNEHREARGFIEESEPDESWSSVTTYEQEAEPEHFVQVLVGIEFDDSDQVYAKILISRDLDAPFCHIIWKQ